MDLDDNVGERTEEEWKQIEKQEEMRLEADMKEAREKRNMENKEKRKALKKALKKQIASLSVRELCEYEKITENRNKKLFDISSPGHCVLFLTLSTLSKLGQIME